MKGILSKAMAVAVVLIMMLVPVSAMVTPTSALNGWDEPSSKGLEYTYNDDGTATVVDWDGKGNLIRNGLVIIPGTVVNGDKTYTVTAIGDGAFEGSGADLKSIQLPSSLVSIGDKAFYGCRELTEVKIPESVTNMGVSAFEECSNLSSVNIPKGITVINDGIFASTNLNKLDIPTGVTSIGSRVFDNCQFIELSLPSTLITIGDHAFRQCKFTELTLPASVSTIGCGAFAGCALTKITVSGSNFTVVDDNHLYTDNGKTLVYWPSTATEVTIPSTVETIGGGAFEYGSVTSITIPNTVKSIGAYAFSNCSSLESVTFEENSKVDVIKENTFSYTKIENITIPSNVKEIGKEAFKQCDILQDVHFETNTKIEVIGDSAFSMCYSIKRFNTDSDNTMIIPATVKSIGKNAFLMVFFDIYYLSFEANSVCESIGDSAFWHCSCLVSVDFGNVKIVGVSAFEECVQLSNINLGVVTDIGDYAFSGITELRSITIPSTVKNIGNGPFYNCENLTSITVDGGTSFVSTTNKDALLTSDGKTLIQWATGVRNVTIPTGVENIGPYAFRGCKMTEVDLTGVKSIGKSAFTLCDQLKSVVIDEGLKRIEAETFWSCSSLESVTLPDSVEYIGDSAFYNCNNSKFKMNSETDGKVCIPENVIEIGSHAFQWCKCTDISVPASVKSIGDGAFIDMWALKTITVDTSNKYYYSEEGVLYGVVNSELILYPMENGNRNLIIPDGITRICSDSVVLDSPYLKSISIPSSVTFIHKGISEYCHFYEIDETIKLTDYSKLPGNAFIQKGDSADMAMWDLELSIDVPDIVNNSINDGTVVYGENIHITGSTKRSTTIDIKLNDLSPETKTLDAEGKFSYDAKLSLRDNTIRFSATIDNATPVKTIHVYYYLEKTVTVDVFQDVGGTVTGAGNYEYGEVVTLTAIPSVGYHFAKWSDGNTDATRTFEVTDDVSLTAYFERNTAIVTIVLSPSDGGTVTGAGTYYEGDTVTLKAVANEGYHFVKWSDGNTDSSRTIVLTGNVELTAVFEKDSLSFWDTPGTIAGVITLSLLLLLLVALLVRYELERFKQ